MVLRIFHPSALTPKIYQKGIEPGYYADGEYGIRIENVVVVSEVWTPNNFGDKGFLGFEHVTMVTSMSPALPPASPVFGRCTDMSSAIVGTHSA